MFMQRYLFEKGACFANVVKALDFKEMVLQK